METADEQTVPPLKHGLVMEEKWICTAAAGSGTDASISADAPAAVAVAVEAAAVVVVVVATKSHTAAADGGADGGSFVVGSTVSLVNGLGSLAKSFVVVDTGNCWKFGQGSKNLKLRCSSWYSKDAKQQGQQQQQQACQRHGMQK